MSKQWIRLKSWFKPVSSMNLKYNFMSLNRSLRFTAPSSD